MNLITKIPFSCYVIGLLFVLSGSLANGQSKEAVTDTAKKLPPALPAAIKPYEDVVPASARKLKSFFQVDIVKDKYFLEIPDSLLKRDILAVTRIEKGNGEIVVPLINLGYDGDEMGRPVISFDRIPGDRLALRSVNFHNVANDTTANGLSHSLENNNLQSIEVIFPIKAFNKKAKSLVIDITDFLNSKNMTSTFAPPVWGPLDIFKFQVPDRGYIEEIQAFPDNIEIKTVKTMVNESKSSTIELNTSLLLLPMAPMKPRLKDARIGFFSNSYVDFDVDSHGVGATRYIQRWRMEPKDEDIEKYKRGELVEPKKPIIIYIDPATPKKWVPYLIAGINDWQAAFEKAGFKNAIFGKEAPVNDSTWSANDARHSMVVYKPSAIENAAGFNVNDPRSGEILETHISWYHSVMALIQNWYTIQAGAIDQRTHKPELDDELMGQLIRFVSSHEVGHTLGLEHNFGASSTVSVENLRNKAWVEEHGHTPSIMDYARFNYVAQPEDNIGPKGIFPRIGDYDKWAIEWGYKWLPQFKSAPEEKDYMNKWIIEKLASGKQYFYGSQLDPTTDNFPLNSIDPRDQSEDLGDDAMLASSYGIKNLKRIEPHLIEWAAKPGGNYDRAAALYKELVGEYSRFMGHVCRNIGGIYETPKTVEQQGPEYELADKAKQKRAMAFLQKQLFTTPYWLMDRKLYLVSPLGFNIVTDVQKKILASLLSSSTMARLISEEDGFPGKAYTASEMLNDLKQGIFSELPLYKSISMYRRDLQKTYVEAVIALLSPKAIGSVNDGLSIIKAHAKLLASEFKNASAHCSDTITRDHLVDMYERLNNTLKPKVQ